MIPLSTQASDVLWVVAGLAVIALILTLLDR